jgi:outer membrane protein OmpA-like peptidoglycan-associated protein
MRGSPLTLGMRLGVVTTVLAFLSAGCATQEWTRDLFAKRTAKLDERFIKVEEQAREQGQRIDRVEGQVASLENRVAETRDLAVVVLERVGGAGVRSEAVARRATRPGLRTLVAVVHVPFGFNRADVDHGAETALASIVKELRENPKMTVDLEGMTDPAGRLEYNLRLSQRRVENVKRWLVASGVEPARIVRSAGRGPLPDASVKDEGKRRVTVKLMSSAE